MSDIVYDDNFSLGEKIKYYRSKAGLTQKELAQRAGLSASAIQLYELGKRTPKTSTLFLLAEALNVPELAPSMNSIPIGNTIAESYMKHYEKERQKQYEDYFVSMREKYETNAFIVDVMDKFPATLTEDQKTIAQKADKELYEIIPNMIDIELDFLSADGCRELQRVIYDMLKNPEYRTEEYEELLSVYKPLEESNDD